MRCAVDPAVVFRVGSCRRLSGESLRAMVFVVFGLW